MLASTNINQSAPNLVKIYMTLRSWMGSIMSLNWTQETLVICPLIRFGVFDFVYTLASTCIYDANLKIFMFEHKRLRALKLCMNHHLVDVYKFCTKDAPGLITGPVLGLGHFYVGIFQPIIR